MNARLQDVAGGRSGPTGGFSGWIAGRARRREYWAWVVPMMGVGIALEMATAPGSTLIVALPLLFSMIRRLHDLGRSGWLAPLINIGVNALSFAFVLMLGADLGAVASFLLYIAVIVTLGALPGQARTNAYGPQPGHKSADFVETFS